MDNQIEGMAKTIDKLQWECGHADVENERLQAELDAAKREIALLKSYANDLLEGEKLLQAENERLRAALLAIDDTLENAALCEQLAAIAKIVKAELAKEQPTHGLR